MALADEDALVVHSFGIEVDGIVIKQIQEISGLKREQDVIDYKSNTSDGKYTVKRLTGRPKPPELTFKRGATKDSGFEDWVKTSRFGKMGEARKGGAVIFYDAEGEVIKRYNFTNGWPKSIEISGLKAGATEPLQETLVMVCEDFGPE
jgi:phage tail-like protein